MCAWAHFCNMDESPVRIPLCRATGTSNISLTLDESLYHIVTLCGIHKVVIKITYA